MMLIAPEALQCAGVTSAAARGGVGELLPPRLLHD